MRSANLARDIFRLDPPVLDVFDASNLRRLALLSGFSVLLWIWSLFFGSSIGLIFSAILIPGVAASEDVRAILLVYAIAILAIMVYGAARIVPVLRRIHGKLHDQRLKVGLARITVAILVVVAGVLLANPDIPGVLAGGEYRTVGPARANAIYGETLIMEGGEVVVLLGIEALRPGQTCFDGDGDAYSCGDQATVHLQSLVATADVVCFVHYPNLGICIPIPEGSPLPESEADAYVAENLQARMVAAGLAFEEIEEARRYLGPLQDEAQPPDRVGPGRARSSRPGPTGRNALRNQRQLNGWPVPRFPPRILSRPTEWPRAPGSVTTPNPWAKPRPGTARRPSTTPPNPRCGPRTTWRLATAPVRSTRRRECRRPALGRRRTARGRNRVWASCRPPSNRAGRTPAACRARRHAVRPSGR